MTKPVISQFDVNDEVNEVITICPDRDADPGVVSFVLDQAGCDDYLYVTLAGLRALVAAAEMLDAQ